MTDKPQRIDMGTRLPLFRSHRPTAHEAILPAVAGLACLIGPVLVYRPGEGFFPRMHWFATVLFVVGLLVVWQCIRVFRFRIAYAIDSRDVRVMIANFQGRNESVEPLATYRAVVGATTLEPGFIGKRPFYHVVLMHSDALHKQVVLYTTFNERAFKQRLAFYGQLLQKPVELDETGKLVAF
jgi:hypothetical protein